MVPANPLTRARQLALLALPVLVVVLTTTASANAALSFRFNRASARPGTLITASQPGWPTAARGVSVYLVPTRLPGIQPDPAGGYILGQPPQSGAIRLGQPRLTASHTLTISFRVPHVPAGNYTTAFWCHTCRKGGDFFASAPWGANATANASTVLRVGRP